MVNKVHGNAIPAPSASGETLVEAEGTLDIRFTRVRLIIGDQPIAEVNYVPERLIRRVIRLFTGGPEALAAPPTAEEAVPNDKFIDLRPNRTASDDGIEKARLDTLRRRAENGDQPAKTEILRRANDGDADAQQVVKDLSLAA